MILITGNRQDHISNDSYQEKQVSFILPQFCHQPVLGHLPDATRSKLVCEVVNGFGATSCFAREVTSPVLSLTKIVDKNIGYD